MGMVHVDVEVSPSGGPGVPVRFLVDSGAVYSVLPRDVWIALGLAPTRRMEFVLADGTAIERDVAHCFFTYEGIEAPSPVVLGEASDDALLGAVTLESMGLVLNPFTRRLRPMRARLATISAP
jgi:clan AA aspartic protease